MSEHRIAVFSLSVVKAALTVCMIVVNRRMRNSYSSKLTLGKPLRPKMSQGKIPSIETFLYIPPMVES